MEWFKHKTNSFDDPDFSAILDDFGSDGYMMFFGLLEIYGKEFSNTDDDGFLHLRIGFVARKLRKSSAKVQKFLNFCEKLISKPRFVYSIKDGMLSYKAPDFIEISSNWTKRKHNTPTEAPTEAPTAIRRKNKKKKKEKEKEVAYPDWINMPLWIEYKKMRNKLKKPLTQYAEKLAINKLEKMTTNNGDKIKIIEQSIMNGWLSFYPLKDNVAQNRPAN